MSLPCFVSDEEVGARTLVTCSPVLTPVPLYTVKASRCLRSELATGIKLKARGRNSTCWVPPSACINAAMICQTALPCVGS